MAAKAMGWIKKTQQRVPVAWSLQRRPEPVDRYDVGLYSFFPRLVGKPFRRNKGVAGSR
jgi:hypothetical protein